MADPYVANPTWKDYPDLTTPATAALMNHLEAGVVEAISRAIVDAKGDLIAATAADAVARVAVGANGTLLTADSAQAAGVRWATPPIAQTYVETFAGGAGNVWPSANRVILTPLSNLTVPFTLTRVQYYVVTQSGNFDMGIYYSDDEATFTKLFSTGATACPAAGARTVTFASQTITPVVNRRWYFALAVDNGTASFRSGDTLGAGAFFKDTSYLLPGSLTGMTATPGFVITHRLAV